MKKLFLNRKPVDGPWGGGNLFVRAMCEMAPTYGYEVVHQLDRDVDVIFMFDPRPGNTGIGINEIFQHKRFFCDVKVIHRVNECDARKGTDDVDDMLRISSQVVDDTVFVSNWMKDYHLSKLYHGGRHHVIYNGVEKNHFRPGPKISETFGGKVQIVAHHWSNNRMKGFDVYEAIDRFVGYNSDICDFTYIGRDLGTFKNSRVIPPLFGKDLGDELSRYDVYVSGSLHDPGPNHILEALACGLPTYVIATGGGAVEFAGQDHAFDDVEEFLTRIKQCNFEPNSFLPGSWENCMSKYFQVIEG